MDNPPSDVHVQYVCNPENMRPKTWQHDAIELEITALSSHEEVRKAVVNLLRSENRPFEEVDTLIAFADRRKGLSCTWVSVLTSKGHASGVQAACLNRLKHYFRHDIRVRLTKNSEYQVDIGNKVIHRKTNAAHITGGHRSVRPQQGAAGSTPKSMSFEGGDNGRDQYRRTQYNRDRIGHDIGRYNLYDHNNSAKGTSEQNGSGLRDSRYTFKSGKASSGRYREGHDNRTQRDRSPAGARSHIYDSAGRDYTTRYSTPDGARKTREQHCDDLAHPRVDHSQTEPNSTPILKLQTRHRHTAPAIAGFPENATNDDAYPANSGTSDKQGLILAIDPTLGGEKPKEQGGVPAIRTVTEAKEDTEHSKTTDPTPSKAIQTTASAKTTPLTSTLRADSTADPAKTENIPVLTSETAKTSLMQRPLVPKTSTGAGTAEDS